MNLIPSSSPTKSRRDFFRSLGRFAALAGLGIFTGGLVARKRVTLPNQDCVNNGICRSCATYTNCGLPAALSAKHARLSSQGVKSHG